MSNEERLRHIKNLTGALYVQFNALAGIQRNVMEQQLYAALHAAYCKLIDKQYALEAQISWGRYKATGMYWSGTSSTTTASISFYTTTGRYWSGTSNG